MLTRLRAALNVFALLGVAGAVMIAAPPASASWGGHDPAFNIAPAPAIFGSVCDASPRSAPCLHVLIDALINGRRSTGLPGYALPARFGYLTPQEKLLVLASQDRGVLGLPPLIGMNALLNRSAQAAIAHRADPAPVTSLGGAHWTLWAANWAGGNGATENPMTAHYLWMYYDGLNRNGSSWNVLCSVHSLGYCWKHRHNVLVEPGSGKQLAIGIGGGPDGHGWYGWTHLIEAFPASASITYVPSVVRTSSDWSPPSGGREITVGGFGFVHVTSVLIYGRPARILHCDPWRLTIVSPPAAPGTKGYVVVRTTGGVSNRTYAAEFHYSG